MSTLHRRTKREGRREGLSIVEVLVALTLVTLALLGMAGTTALALRQITDATARRFATNTAVSRFGMLAAEGCLRASSGWRIDTRTGLREHWIVSGSNSFARVSDTIVWNSPRGPRAMSLDSAFPC